MSDMAASSAIRGEIGGCEIWDEIARGGMGIVYRGFQRALGRVVAVKMLDPGLASSPEFRERFRNEAATIGRLSHPNVVRVHDIEESGGTWYLVMELVGGPSVWHVTQGAGALHSRAPRTSRTRPRPLSPRRTRPASSIATSSRRTSSSRRRGRSR
jgi:serine/threonine protein kinase